MFGKIFSFFLCQSSSCIKRSHNGFDKRAMSLVRVRGVDKSDYHEKKFQLHAELPKNGDKYVFMTGTETEFCNLCRAFGNALHVFVQTGFGQQFIHEQG